MRGKSVESSSPVASPTTKQRASLPTKDMSAPLTATALPARTPLGVQTSLARTMGSLGGSSVGRFTAPIPSEMRISVSRCALSRADNYFIKLEIACDSTSVYRFRTDVVSGSASPRFSCADFSFRLADAQAILAPGTAATLRLDLCVASVSAPVRRVARAALLLPRRISLGGPPAPLRVDIGADQALTSTPTTTTTSTPSSADLSGSIELSISLVPATVTPTTTSSGSPSSSSNTTPRGRASPTANSSTPVSRRQSAAQPLSALTTASTSPSLGLAATATSSSSSSSSAPLSSWSMPAPATPVSPSPSQTTGGPVKRAASRQHTLSRPHGTRSESLSSSSSASSPTQPLTPAHRRTSLQSQQLQQLQLQSISTASLASPSLVSLGPAPSEAATTAMTTNVAPSSYTMSPSSSVTASSPKHALPSTTASTTTTTTTTTAAKSLVAPATAHRSNSSPMSFSTHTGDTGLRIGQLRASVAEGTVTVVVVAHRADQVPQINGKIPRAFVTAKTGKDAAERLPARAATHAADPSCSPVWSEVLVLEGIPDSRRDAGETILLTLADSVTKRYLGRYTLAMNELVPMQQYNLALRASPTAKSPSSACLWVTVTLLPHGIPDSLPPDLLDFTLSGFNSTLPFVDTVVACARIVRDYDAYVASLSDANSSRAHSIPVTDLQRPGSSSTDSFKLQGVDNMSETDVCAPQLTLPVGPSDHPIFNHTFMFTDARSLLGKPNVNALYVVLEFYRASDTTWPNGAYFAHGVVPLSRIHSALAMVASGTPTRIDRIPVHLAPTMSTSQMPDDGFFIDCTAALTRSSSPLHTRRPVQLAVDTKLQSSSVADTTVAAVVPDSRPPPGLSQQLPLSRGPSSADSSSGSTSSVTRPMAHSRTSSATGRSAMPFSPDSFYDDRGLVMSPRSPSLVSPRSPRVYSGAPPSPTHRMSSPDPNLSYEALSERCRALARALKQETRRAAQLKMQLAGSGMDRETQARIRDLQRQLDDAHSTLEAQSAASSAGDTDTPVTAQSSPSLIETELRERLALVTEEKERAHRDAEEVRMELLMRCRRAEGRVHTLETEMRDMRDSHTRDMETLKEQMASLMARQGSSSNTSSSSTTPPSNSKTLSLNMGTTNSSSSSSGSPHHRSPLSDPIPSTSYVPSAANAASPTRSASRPSSGTSWRTPNH